MEQGKRLRDSWTMIFNSLVVASDIAMAVGMTGVLPPGVASIIALVNIALRMKTKEPLKLPKWYE